MMMMLMVLLMTVEALLLLRGEDEAVFGGVAHHVDEVLSVHRDP
jgi:hypothetical protein